MDNFYLSVLVLRVSYSRCLIYKVHTAPWNVKPNHLSKKFFLFLSGFLPRVSRQLFSLPGMSFFLLSHQAHTENGNSQRRQVSHGKQVPGNDLIPIGNGYTAQKDDPVIPQPCFLDSFRPSSCAAKPPQAQKKEPKQRRIPRTHSAEANSSSR